MINNPIPLVRISSVTAGTPATVSDFNSTYAYPIVDKFYLEFDVPFTPNSNTSDFVRSTDTAIPMLTRTGGNVMTNMIAQAILLKKYGIMPMICNPYRFRMVRLYNPDRVVFVDPLPCDYTVPSTTPAPSSESSETPTQSGTTETPSTASTAPTPALTNLAAITF